MTRESTTLRAELAGARDFPMHSDQRERMTKDRKVQTLKSRSLLCSKIFKDAAGVAELVDARDLKSLVSNGVPVRVRPSAPEKDSVQ